MIIDNSDIIVKQPLIRINNGDYPAFSSLTIEQIKANDFSRHLLSMDPRFIFHGFPDTYAIKGSKNRLVAFFLTREHIVMPHIVATIYHEIAHCVEMKNSKRWTLPDWGLQVFGGKEQPSNSSFFAAYARELRVRTISYIISETPPDASSGYFWRTEAPRRLPFGRFKTPQDILDWSANLTEQTLKHWNKDRIEAEWKVRLKAMQYEMETCHATHN